MYIIMWEDLRTTNIPLCPIHNALSPPLRKQRCSVNPNPLPPAPPRTLRRFLTVTMATSRSVKSSWDDRAHRYTNMGGLGVVVGVEGKGGRFAHSLQY